ncbi:MAG: DHH family phosphoesterase, partial [Synergistaceae bacterium]|nr:DHH family phosphoesterase [Synergistaceae bacterium]
MRLGDLLNEGRIAIQCHDNPDADALASGFGLYRFFEAAGVGLKDLKFFYGGAAVTKPNLTRMIDELRIPAEHEPNMKEWDGLLVNVDCQHGAGNVARVPAPRVAVIDHHIQERELPALCELRPWLGSCSTLVWHLLVQEAYPIDVSLATALHYGLFSDTNGFSELRHPLDRDMWDALEVDHRVLGRLKRSNLTFSDLSTASAALSGLYSDTEFGFVVIPVPPCDPNLLGFISDMSMQVDGVDIAVAYSAGIDGVKFSTRAAVREVKASDLAAWLARDAGSGGGHREKAGGYIAGEKFSERFGGLPFAAYFTEAIRDYIRNCTVIDCAGISEQAAAMLDPAAMKTYRKLPARLGFVPCHMLFEGKAGLQIRMLEGDMDIAADEETVLMIGVKGEVYPIELEKFIETYTLTGERFDPDLPYGPTVLNKNTGIRVSLMEYANTCVGTDESKVSAMRLESRVEVFTRWDAENYLRGSPGDWLAARSPDDLYIIGGDVFDALYIRDCTGENLSLMEDAVLAVKKIIPLSVAFASEPGILNTREGQVSYKEGDALLRGTAGESWPVARERFLETYSP